MAHFWKGWSAGTVTGIIYGLFTAKHTGAQNQQRVACYFKNITQATNEVTTSLIEVKNALNTLKNEVNKASRTTIIDLKDMIQAFKFTMKPRINAVKEDTKHLKDNLVKKN